MLIGRQNADTAPSACIASLAAEGRISGSGRAADGLIDKRLRDGVKNCFVAIYETHASTFMLCSPIRPPR